MLEVIDATNTIESVDTDFTPETMEAHNEQKLGDEIASLWSAHVNAKNTARATKAELSDIRAKLGEHLHELKQVLAQPGRGGRWSSFLRQRGIPRATADRLVGHYEQSINPDANRPSEPVSEPTEEEVHKLFTSVWPKLRRTLRSQQSVLLFVDLLTSHFKSGEPTAHELPAVMPATAMFDPPSSDGDSSVEPEFHSTLPPEPDRATICAS